jgi:hypothetical protein
MLTRRQHYAYVAVCLAMVAFTLAFWLIAMPALLPGADA